MNPKTPNSPNLSQGYGYLKQDKWFVFLLIVVSVVLCYFFVDRKLVLFFHEHSFRRFRIIHYIQDLPVYLLYLCPLLLLYGLIQLIRKQQTTWNLFCLVVPLSLLFSALIKPYFKLPFGHYWPETFKNNNPSFIHNQAYGFHPFQRGIAYESFPSGHCLMIFCFAALCIYYYPQLKWLWLTCCMLVILGLVLLNYHFLSDIIAGSYIGYTLGKGYIGLSKKIRILRMQ